MVTLWILIFGFKNMGASVTPFAGQPVLQAVATYRTPHECDVASKAVFVGLQDGGIAVNALCLPTGVSDPVHGRATGSHSN